MNCINLKEITLPDSVTSVGVSAFSGCTGLKSVTLSKGMADMPEGMFFGCTSLKELTIPDNVKKIGRFAFENCTTLEKVTLPKGLTVVTEDLFYDCKKLKEITIPDSVKKIEEFAFSGCKALKEVTIPKNVKAIGMYAFSDCTDLKTVTLPDSVKSISATAFAGCSDDFTIKCNTGSYAQQFAKKNNIQCEIMDKTQHKHNYTDSVTIEKATTKKDGSQMNACSVCGESKKSTIYRADQVTVSAENYTYTGKAQKPSVTVLNSQGKKISSKYYTVSYKNNKNVGNADVTVKLKGNYSGTLKTTFTITPKQTKFSKVSAMSKGISVKWKKQEKQISGYEIQYSTDKTFAKGKTNKVTAGKMRRVQRFQS